MTPTMGGKERGGLRVARLRLPVLVRGGALDEPADFLRRLDRFLG